MIWSLAWRNVWRNKLRSAVVIIAVALGLFAGVFSTALMKGMSDKRAEDAIHTEISHIQIHKKGFLLNSDVSLYMDNVDEMLEEINKMEHVEGATKRISQMLMVATTETSSGADINVVDTTSEKQVTNIYSKITEGRYFDNYKRKHSVVIGKKLAEKLDIGVGKKMIVTLVNENGENIPVNTKVSGIYETDNHSYDEMHVFLKYDKIAPIIGLSQNQAHEIAILLDDTENTEEVMAKLKEMYPDLDIQPWDKISPEVGYMSKAMDQYMYMIVVIILLALCFGIINTMLMVVLERIKELGMLMAVGMNKGRVFSMIMLESVFLTIVGGIIGIILGFVVSYYFGQNGLVLPVKYADAFKDLGYSNIMYPEVDMGMVITVTIMVILTGVISAIYPAWKALRLDPAEAIRTDN